MKFIIVFLASSLLALIYATETKTVSKVKIQTRAKSKTANKAMAITRLGMKKTEFFNDYLNSFLSDSNSEDMFSDAPANSTATPASGGSNSTGGANATGGNATGGKMLEDWFTMASTNLKNAQKFPPVKLKTGEEIRIGLGPKHKRKNDAFDSITDNKPATENHFYFRLTPNILYYASTKDDLNVLGALKIDRVSTCIKAPGDPIGTNQSYCLNLADDESDKWTMCHTDEKTVAKWECYIQKYMGIPRQDCDNIAAPANVTKPTIITVERSTIQPIIMIPLPSPECNEHWDYQSEGDDWNCECSEGHEQSPIDLPAPKDAIPSPAKPIIEYDEIDCKGNLTALMIRIEGNALRIKYDNFGKLVTLDGSVYHATEIVFHSPGEHTIDGKKYAMEVQIIHSGVSKGDLGKQAILAFPVEQAPGIYNKFFDELDFFNLPSVLSRKRELDGLFVPNIFYEPEETAGVSIKPFSFYTYQGSLTSPPCYEGTVVYVASKPIKLGTTAIRLFQEALRVPDMMSPTGDIAVSSVIPKSNRKIQDKNGRPVFYYDHTQYCGPDPIKKSEEPKGHYEKIPKVATQYFYVSNNDPSGLPGATIVSEEEATGKVPSGAPPSASKVGARR